MSRRSGAPDTPAASTTGETRPGERRSAGRPDYLSILLGFVDAHVTGVHFIDTRGGDEFVKIYRRRRQRSPRRGDSGGAARSLPEQRPREGS